MVDKVNWKQSVIGCEGRMNPSIYQVWQTLRGMILSRIWESRNAILHRVSNFDYSSIGRLRNLVVEGLVLAITRERGRINATVGLLFRKVHNLQCSKNG